MGIKRWHYGKVIILWAWGVLITGFALQALDMIATERFMIGTALLVAIAGIPAVLSIITWKWLSGKESREE
jgi:hypothetical protein